MKASDFEMQTIVKCYVVSQHEIDRDGMVVSGTERMIRPYRTFAEAENSRVVQVDRCTPHYVNGEYVGATIVNVNRHEFDLKTFDLLFGYLP